MITHAGQVKCFSLSQKQVLISGPCLQTLAHVSFSFPAPSSSWLLLPSSLQLLPQGLLFTAQYLLLSAVCDRTYQ